MPGPVLSRHFFRRRARMAALRLRLAHPGHHYSVRPAKRAPYRWYVIES
jgi:hypothetical protein